MKALSSSHPVWFCDIWGVVHDGFKPFARTVAVLEHHRKAGGTVILVTNAPRPAVEIAKHLHSIGVSQQAYDAIVSSGDVTRSLMVAQGGGKLYHLGPAYDRSIFEGLAVERVELESATSVLCTGLMEERRENPQDYLPLLENMKRRNLTMICANPDKVVRKGQHLIYCAGALAELYTNMDGRVLMAGKPYAPIYELALGTAAKLRGHSITKNQILAIGDGPETDIRGAVDFDLACVFITGGINSGENVSGEVARNFPTARILRSMVELDWT